MQSRSASYKEVRINLVAVRGIDFKAVEIIISETDGIAGVYKATITVTCYILCLYTNGKSKK